MQNEAHVTKDLLFQLYKRRWRIMIVTALFVALGATVSLFMPKKYTAFGVVYPTASNSMKEVAKNPMIGYEAEVDRLIQLFNSKEIRDAVVKKFELMKYYGLDSTQLGWRYALDHNYSQDVTFKRSNLLSVVIQANMKDSQLAADIVNFLIDHIDEARKNLYQENLIVLMEKITTRRDEQEKHVFALLEEISGVGKSASVELLTERRLSQIEERKRNGEYIQGDEVISSQLSKVGGVLLEQKIDAYYRELEVLNGLRGEASELEETLDLPFPGIYVISRAESTDKKVSPNVTMNALFAGIVGFLFVVVFTALEQRWKSFRSAANDA